MRFREPEVDSQTPSGAGPRAGVTAAGPRAGVTGTGLESSGRSRDTREGSREPVCPNKARLRRLCDKSGHPDSPARALALALNSVGGAEGDAEQLTRLGDRRGPTTGVDGHSARNCNQLTVGARHRAVRQVEIVLEAGADRAAE